MEEEVATYIKGLESQRDDAVSKSNQLANATGSMFANSQDSNLIEYQLGLDDISERLEHLLRGDVLVVDSKGGVKWATPKNSDGSDNTDLQVLNEYGVQFIMNVILSYLNRNTLLSNYSEKRIGQILYDVGYEITDQIYLNAEQMGLDTPNKQKRYSIIVLQVIHTIESAYNRAYRGEERSSLREARIVTQNASVQNMPGLPGSSQKQFSLFKPKTWVR